MNLKKYRSKRNFKESKEPKGIQKKSSDSLNFCIQKHAARQLHYDFRLEYHGVLLSWAVPKGPSLDPEIKRLAVKVEDHPLDYQYFEGTIPKGNYGAGKVEIWDHGTYTVPNSKNLIEAEKILSQGLKKGHLVVSLNGSKLKGDFVFQKMKKDPEDSAWLLIKRDDAYSSKDQNLENLDNQPQKIDSEKKIPKIISPMLATLISEPFDNKEWLFEVKWDGYRSLAFLAEGKVELKSRTGRTWNEKFPEIVENLKKIKEELILDGELVILDSKGAPSFQLMQNYQKTGKGALYYYLFDLLYYNGKDLREIALIERKEILKKILKEYSLPIIRFSNHIFEKGKAFFKEACKIKLEGIMAKKKSSEYESKRSKNWLKIKTHLGQEVVIGGFTAPSGSRKKFGALLVGLYDKKKQLLYVGRVGGGFNAKLLEQVHEKLQPLIQDHSPFKNGPQKTASITWTKPLIVCEVSFAEWTDENRMRQPIFKGLRIDKLPKKVKKEESETTKKVIAKTEKEPTLTHLDKIYWPKESYTKADLINYYKQIAPFILPYLKNRPIMLHRFPNGINGEDFYQKDLNHHHPEWVKICPIQQEEKINHYLLINDLNSLLYAVNLGSIELHPFLARCKKLENPDYCVIDLDPHEISFTKVIDIALFLHHLLTEIDVKHYCKTSGGKGLHIFIPLQRNYSFDQSRQFAEILSLIVHKHLPNITSMERKPVNREKKVYLDCLQNRIHQTIAAPYSVRPHIHAPVSTPLDWKEVNYDLDISSFNIKTIFKRLKKKGDLFKPVLKEKVNLKTALKRLENF